jgi:nitroreductase
MAVKSTGAQAVNRWTDEEMTTVVEAVRRAPSVHNIQPWLLEFSAGDVHLFERFDLGLPQHDPMGRDRLMSCGAALTNLRLAVRALGRSERWTPFPDPARPDEVARVRTTGRHTPALDELAARRAVNDRHSHRARFGPQRVSVPVVRALAGAITVPGVHARPVHDMAEAAALADVLTYAAGVLRDDHAYQRELLAWTGGNGAMVEGIPEATLPEGALPWTGLVRSTTRIPDRDTLASRLAAETQLVMITTGDGRSDHLLAGAAIEQIWLAATQQGLAASLITQPLHLHEARAGLIEHLDLPGFPQAWLRIGYPAAVVPPSPRRPRTELLREPAEGGTP